MLRCSHGVAQGAEGPAGGLVGVGQYQRCRGPLALAQVLQGAQAVAQVGRGQHRPLPHHARGTAIGKGDQQVVRSLAVVVHPHGLPLGVGVGDHGGHVVEHGHGVQAFGQAAGTTPGDTGYSLRKRSVPCSASAAASMPRSVGKWRRLGFGPRAAQVVGNRVRQAPPLKFRQPAAQGGDGNPAEGGQFLHCGQGRGAQQPQGVLQGLGQGVWDRPPGAGYGGLAVMAQAAASMASGLSPTALTTALGRARPRCPRSRQRHRVWRETPKCRAAWGLAVPQGVGAHVVADGVVEVVVVRFFLYWNWACWCWLLSI